jgi:hypothetical protein
MFKFLFGDTLSRLQKQYEKKMEMAMHAQRNGNIALYAELSSEAEKLLNEIDLQKSKLKQS